jgi:hypothetical protein
MLVKQHSYNPLNCSLHYKKEICAKSSWLCIRLLKQYIYSLAECAMHHSNGMFTILLDDACVQSSQTISLLSEC